MFVRKINVSKSGRVSKIINLEYPNISYNQIQKLFRNKDIKLNGIRLSKDVMAKELDKIIFYTKEDSSLFYEEIFEDDNLLVVNKKRNIEVVSKQENDLVKQIKQDKNLDVFAVHRLDRNTQGLVIFAKNIEAKKELDEGFKNHNFEKFYMANVYGVMEKSKEKLISYLKKNEGRSKVYIFDNQVEGSVLIKTNYKVVKQFKESAILEIELITGKTHQIRAHLAHIGHFILGDEKYGNSRINAKFGKKYQNLICFRLILHFFNEGKLNYLNNKIFEIEKEKIDFLKN